ncbi:MAG: helix-turn-helix domain-containing protein, partial [Bacteriovoracaceae bacterium]|nr:helix-turn-helix domain-containing protein [Bacteriovoracaceae bacterium]
NISRAKFIKKARQERAWPQQQLADVAGVNLRTIQRLEKDGSASFETLMGVAQAFNIDVKELNQISSSNEKINSQKKVYLLPRLVTGKHLTDVVLGADQFQVEHDEADDPRAVNSMKGILVLLKQDIVRFYDADPSKLLQIEAEMSQEIKGLESFGFFLFGTKRVIPRVLGKVKTEITMCTLYMSHSNSPRVLRNKNSNMMVPALLTEVAK